MLFDSNECNELDLKDGDVIRQGMVGMVTGVVTLIN